MKTAEFYRTQWLNTVRDLNHCQELLYWWHDAYPPRPVLEHDLAVLTTHEAQWRQMYENAQHLEHEAAP